MLDDLIPKVELPEGRKGAWEIRRFDVEDSVVMRMRERHFQPGAYTMLRHDSRGLVMSDTPAERRDHFGFVMEATGRVLISGLGLGMCLGAVLKKPDVSHVTVLEIDQDVIDLVAPHYEDERLRVICADATEWKPTKGERFNAVWHDIWDTMCMDNMPEMVKLRRRWGQLSDWCGCWSQDWLRAHA